MATLDANPQQGGSTDNQMSFSNSKVPPTKRDARKLFVGGLPSNVTEEEFREFFEQYGTVVDSVVMFDRDTRRSRGFGFVTFEDPVRS
jgi:RNA recognition motif-containing protein